ncbi:hypothetical protein ACB094_10G010900 [Castanea mollissima]
MNELSFPNTDELGHHVSVQHPFFLIEKDTFPNLKELYLDWNETMSQTYGRLFGEFFGKLEVLSLCGKDDKLIAVPSVFVEGLCYLKSLFVTNLFLDNEGQYAGRFERLTELNLYKMPKLMLLWKENSQQVKSLVQLKILFISRCKRMIEIVTNEGEGEAGDEICFNQLNDLYLTDLPSLRSFHLGNRTIKFPSLGYLQVFGCPEMQIFSNGVLSMPKLKRPRLGENWEWSCRRKLLPEEDVNGAIKRNWEENYDACVQQLFTEKENGVDDLEDDSKED